MDTTTHAQDSITSKKPTALKTFLISGLGTALEYYDFLIYGLAAGMVFNVLFFPGEDPLIGTLYAFAAFGTGFLARPLGGIVIGHFGDRIGRRPMLILTLIVMGLATLGIGLLPTYETAGVWAPILLVTLRLVQGFAAGGEWGGAALFGLENAPSNRRGFWASFTSMGIGIGTFLGVLVFAIVSAIAGDAFIEFAWRIPFWLGGVLVIIGMMARLGMPEEEPQEKHENDSVPIVETIKTKPKQIIYVLGVSYGYNTIAYIGFTYFLSYLTGIGYGETESLISQLFYSAVLILSAPFFGLLSDRIGRRPVMVIGGIAMAIFLFMYFPIVGTGSIVLVALAFAITGLLTGITQGPIPSFAGEQFPARLRYSGMSASYQIGAALGGGTASFIATGLLILGNGNPTLIAVYGAVAMLILVLCSLGLKETAFRTTEEIQG